MPCRVRRLVTTHGFFTAKKKRDSQGASSPIGPTCEKEILFYRTFALIAPANHLESLLQHKNSLVHASRTREHLPQRFAPTIGSETPAAGAARREMVWISGVSSRWVRNTP